MQLIDKKAAYNALKHEAETHELSFSAEAYDRAARIIDQMPTIEPEVRHGEWVETEPDEDDRKIGIEFSIKCSRCHDENSHLNFNENHEITGKTFWKSRFCPNCGAYMRGVSKDAGSKTD